MPGPESGAARPSRWGSARCWRASPPGRQPGGADVVRRRHHRDGVRHAAGACSRRWRTKASGPVKAAPRWRRWPRRSRWVRSAAGVLGWLPRIRRQGLRGGGRHRRGAWRSRVSYAAAGLADGQWCHAVDCVGLFGTGESGRHGVGGVPVHDPAGGWHPTTRGRLQERSSSSSAADRACRRGGARRRRRGAGHDGRRSRRWPAGGGRSAAGRCSLHPHSCATGPTPETTINTSAD